MSRLLPRIRFGAGWLYVLAGLALCAAGILVPARADLEALRRQRDRLADEKAIAQKRVEAYESFLRLLEADDPALIRRLAAAQLNLVPEGEVPVLMAASRTATVTDWIDGNVSAAPRPTAPPRDTMLSRLVGGPRRLWALAAGVVVVFVGLLLDDGRVPARRRPTPPLPHWPAAPAGRRRPVSAARACSDPELNPWYDE
jgi:hypothetical protein